MNTKVTQSQYEQIEGLISQMTVSSQFDNLKIFLHREENTDYFEQYDFLLVSPSTFGIVKILDLSVMDDFIILSVFDYSSNGSGQIRIDIHETNPKIFFINLQDIKTLLQVKANLDLLNSDSIEFVK